MENASEAELQFPWWLIENDGNFAEADQIYDKDRMMTNIVWVQNFIFHRYSYFL